MRVIYILMFMISGAIQLESRASTPPGDYLIQVTNEMKSQPLMLFNSLPAGTIVEDLQINNWLHIKSPQNEMISHSFQLQNLKLNSQIIHAQPNYPLSIWGGNENLFSQQEVALHHSVWSQHIEKQISQIFNDNLTPLAEDLAAKILDNPAIPEISNTTNGPDKLMPQQWSMNALRVTDAWKTKPAEKSVVVAVIDTGVDYTHEDLVDNLWRNPGETGLDSQGKNKSSNGIDDDHNGFVDDVIGWDFASNDNLPYDLTVTPSEIIFGGGNPGHGTHVSGCVAARSDNGKGVVGVGDNQVKIMAIRFITEKGQGTTADAIKAIRYAVDNGAQVSNNSWGSEGEDPSEAADNQALRDVITYAQNKGHLFVAAAGNGHEGVGYDNDHDSKPGFPASYNHDNIISVAAIDKNDHLGSFSNWGIHSVDIGAPGVAIFSTMVNNRYSDLVIDMFGIKATWDGTSMAAPHVSGALALYWSRNPNKSWQEVKQVLLESAQSVPSLTGKVVSGGKLDVRTMMNH